jgi:Holliday junction resolvase
VTAYENGTRLERRVAKQLEEDGYQVISSKGSKGAADLWAMKAGVTHFVQVQRHPWLSAEKWNALYRAHELVAGVPVFVHVEGRRLVWWRLTGYKVPYARVQPREPWTPDEVGDAA